MLAFTTRPLMATPGWAAKAYDQGMRVTYRSGRFGRTEYIVKDDVARVRLTQAPESRMRGVLDNPSLGEQLLLKRLSRLGVVEIEPERPVRAVSPRASRRRRAR